MPPQNRFFAPSLPDFVRHSIKVIVAQVFVKPAAPAGRGCAVSSDGARAVCTYTQFPAPSDEDLPRLLQLTCGGGALTFYPQDASQRITHVDYEGCAHIIKIFSHIAGTLHPGRSCVTLGL